MKKLFLLAAVTIFLCTLSFLAPRPAHAAAFPSGDEVGAFGSLIGAASKTLVPIYIPAGTKPEDDYLNDVTVTMENMHKYFGGGLTKDASGNYVSLGVLGIQDKVVAMLYENQISSKEYVADLLNNIGVPSVSHAYAAATSAGGYNYMSTFLPFWKVFRNLAYSLYIVMFIVVGIMIMLRTKVNAQTIITIQSALPNLLITLILITFSYAIVGFMIDIMYFLIYFAVYLIATAGIITDPGKLVTHLMSNSAVGVIFTGRWSIIAGIASSLHSILFGLGTGALGVAGSVLSLVSPMFLIVAVAFVIAMIKLMFALIKAYMMVIFQTITAPIQILMNALPGSKAFGDWLKKTASYIIPFPVAAVMFIFSAILVGNPTDRTTFVYQLGGDTNPFGIKQDADLYANRDSMWLPPFTLTDAKVNNQDVLTLLGFVVFLMTPAAVKMAQDWLQVKESPYTAEAMGNFALGSKAGTMAPSWLWKSFQEEQAAQRSAKALGGVIGQQGELSKKRDLGTN